jgi:hypothetical protein
VALEYTEKQTEAYYLITESGARNIMLYGGARSGKSVLIVSLLIAWCCEYPGLRALIARLRFSHARTTIWHQTVRDLLKYRLPVAWKENRADWFIEFGNGSELWLGGFDEKERTEKILGSEFNVIYLNEVSQLSYDIVEMAMPRLAKSVGGFDNMAIFDCNPPSPLHWTHKLFIEKVQPRTGEAVKQPELYACMRMNPADNQAHLPKDYIQTQLETLPERARRRFLLGEFVKAEGTVYDEFDETYICKRKDVPDIERYSVGLDFGLNMAAVLIGWVGDSIYVLDDYGAYGTTANSFNAAISRNWGAFPYVAWCDPAGGERLQEITNSDKANNSVEPGIDAINNKIHSRQFFVCDNCAGVLSEIWDYRRDDKERIVKLNDHFMDAMRYGIFSEIATPLQIFIG